MCETQGSIPTTAKEGKGGELAVMPTILPVVGIKGTFVELASPVQQGREAVREQRDRHTMGGTVRECLLQGTLGEGTC